MTNAELLKYVKGVFDAELSIYVQERTLVGLKETCDGLATGIRVKEPKLRANTESIFDSISLFGKIFGGILGVFAFVVMMFDSGNFVARIFMALFGFVVFGAIGIGVGIVIGIIVGIIRKIIEQRRIVKKYYSDFEKYQQDLSRDKLRLDIEKQKKSVLKKDIAAMENQIAVAKQNLKKIYSYGIIAPNYRNLSAVGTIYGYLVNGRTYSLTFDPKTGDRGAYNIFEEEKRLDQIITNTEEILYCLDSIAQTQRELAEGLRTANSQIGVLQKEFTKFATKTVNNLEEIKSIEAVNSYNLNCIRKQTELMNWLTIVRY